MFWLSIPPECNEALYYCPSQICNIYHFYGCNFRICYHFIHFHEIRFLTSYVYVLILKIRKQLRHYIDGWKFVKYVPNVKLFFNKFEIISHLSRFLIKFKSSQRERMRLNISVFNGWNREKPFPMISARFFSVENFYIILLGTCAFLRWRTLWVNKFTTFLWWCISKFLRIAIIRIIITLDSTLTWRTGALFYIRQLHTF